jgi:hypothetical protein
VSHDVDARRFLAAGVLERAVLLLMRAFRDPAEPVSRVNVARAVEAQSGAALAPGVTGGFAIATSGGGPANPQALRLVSEAWQILESARLICRDLSQTSGDWWVRTEAGRQVRDEPAPEQAVRARIAGEV